MAIKAQQIIRTEKLGGGAPGAFIPQGVIERRGLQAVTQATGALAKGLFEFGQQVQTSVRRDMVSHQYALAQKDVADSELNMKADPDHRSVPEKFSRSLSDIRAKHSSEIFDPVARNMFQQKFLGYATTREIQMKYNVWNREGEAQRGHLVEDLEIKARLIEQTGDDPVAYNILLEEGIDGVNQVVAAGHMADDAGAKLRVGWLVKSAERRATVSVKSDPFEALSKLESKNWKAFFPFVSDEKRLGFIDSAKTRIKNINAIIKQDNKERKLAIKEEREALEDIVADNFLTLIESGTTEELLKFDPMEILNSRLPSKGPNSKQTFLDMREKEIDERLTGKKNPYKISEPKFEAEQLEKAMNGELDPRDVHVIPNKLSMDAMRTIKNEARVARGATGDTLRKQYQELKRLAVNDGRAQILQGSELLGTVSQASRARANIFHQNLLKSLVEEPDLKKRISMLTAGTPDYIVDQLVIPNLPPIREQMQELQEKFAEPEKQVGVIFRKENERILKTFGVRVSDESLEAVSALRNEGLTPNKERIDFFMKQIFKRQLKERQGR